MNIAVFGATGGTGREVVKQALAQGYQVTAFIQNPHRLPIQDRRLKSSRCGDFSGASHR